MADHPTHSPQPPASSFNPRAVYSVKRLADELDVSIRTVERLIAAQKIRTIPISTRRIGIPATELARIVAGGLLDAAEDVA